MSVRLWRFSFGASKSERVVERAHSTEFYEKFELFLDIFDQSQFSMSRIICIFLMFLNFRNISFYFWHLFITSIQKKIIATIVSPNSNFSKSLRRLAKKCPTNSFWKVFINSDQNHFTKTHIVFKKKCCNLWKSTEIWFSRSIFYVNNHLNLSKFDFHFKIVV